MRRTAQQANVTHGRFSVRFLYDEHPTFSRLVGMLVFSVSPSLTHASMCPASARCSPSATSSTASPTHSAPPRTWRLRRPPWESPHASSPEERRPSTATRENACLRNGRRNGLPLLRAPRLRRRRAAQSQGEEARTGGDCGGVRFG